MPTIYVLEQKLEKKVYPCGPHFYYIKVGCKRVYITRTCFHDEINTSAYATCMKPDQMSQSVRRLIGVMQFLHFCILSVKVVNCFPCLQFLMAKF